MKNKLIGLMLTLTMVMSVLSAFSVTSFATDDELINEIVGEDEAEVQDGDWDDWDDWYDWDVPEIPAVTNLKIKNTKWNTTTLTWSNPDDVDGYDIYIEEELLKDGWIYLNYKEEILIEDPTVVTYKVKDLLPSRTYYFRIIPFKYVDGERYFAEIWDCSCKTVKTQPCPKGSFYTSNKKLAKSLNKVIKKYKENAKFKKSGECYGYAEWGSTQIAKSRSKTNIKKKFSKKNIEKYIVGLKAGAHVRLKREGMEHSVLIIKATKKCIYWADCNWNHDNRVHYYAGNVAAFYDTYSNYSKILWVMKTKSYK